MTTPHTGGGKLPQGRAGEGWLAAWGSAWNTFWFTPADPLPLAIIRIGAGGLLAWSSLVWLLDADAFFGASAWLPPEETWRMNDQPWQWSWFFLTSSTTAIHLLAAITLVAALCLMLGLATPVAAMIALVGFISASNRAPLNVFGFDDILGMLLIPVALGPSGAVLSLDRRWGLRLDGTGPSVLANICLRLIQIHLCVVYFFSGAGKLLGASWWEGTALWGSIANDRYRTLDLRWLASHPLLTNALTLGTLFWELSYPALVWPRLTRRLALGMGVLVHLGIGVAMGMMEFGLTMILANMSFVPAPAFHSLLNWCFNRSVPPQNISENLA